MAFKAQINYLHIILSMNKWHFWVAVLVSSTLFSACVSNGVNSPPSNSTNTSNHSAVRAQLPADASTQDLAEQASLVKKGLYRHRDGSTRSLNADGAEPIWEATERGPVSEKEARIQELAPIRFSLPE